MGPLGGEKLKINPIVWNGEIIPHETDVTSDCDIRTIARQLTEFEDYQPVVIDGVPARVNVQVWSGCSCGKRHFSHTIMC